ncbi:unnamed protein product [Adineta ricciae]|uniref:Uncharacterized protein n=1 Tax=Adineta ricciae TaxID=249248 RepID=A0A814WKH9_ADIRI|nr:unnamed protein product [Adineta ricciae]CAF1203715.1 unnamed protein product [Adineta ricciae]
MPNSYHYFEAGEVSLQRIQLEIEILRQLQEANLLYDIDWGAYDTVALKLFVQAGINEVKNELDRRQTQQITSFEQVNFIKLSVQRSFVKQEDFQSKSSSVILILNTVLIIFCILSIGGLLLYEYVHFNDEHRLFMTLDYPLTAKRRQLSFTDNLSIILLTFTSYLVVSYVITATRLNRKLILFGILTLLIVILFLIRKVYQVMTFLSKHREIRWANLYDYLNS